MSLNEDIFSFYRKKHRFSLVLPLHDVIFTIKKAFSLFIEIKKGLF